MKNILFALAFIISGLSCYCQQTSNDTIHWSASRKLDWKDFAGKPVGKTAMLGQATMLMNAKYHKTLKAKTAVETIFDRKKSQVIEGEKTAQKLQYYQTMFDLYEVASRKLRKQFKENKLGLDPEKAFHERYNAAQKELDERVDLYIEETESGGEASEVDKWFKMVQLELKELEAFSAASNTDKKK